MDRPADRCLSCADCGVYNCRKLDKRFPGFCLTTGLEPGELDRVLALFQEPENHRVAVASAEVEYEGYLKLTRVEEIMRFAGKLGFKRLGVATCAGLIQETKTLTRILRAHGFEVYAAICKVGAVEKHQIGIPKECEEIGLTMCNPILQAELLNKQGTELNIVMGLCVGHDSLFYKYAKALTTTLVTKDRVLGHNPAAALYNVGCYYSRLLEPDGTEEEA